MKSYSKEFKSDLQLKTAIFRAIKFTNDDYRSLTFFFLTLLDDNLSVRQIRKILSVKELKKRDILIISRSFFPVNSPRSFRTTELVKEFARQGHKVTLLTVKNDQFHIPFEKKYGVTIKDLGPMTFKKVDISTGIPAAGFIKRIFRRGLNLFFEYPDIELVQKVKKALKTEQGYDLLISVAVPHPIHWGVAMARKRKKAIANKWIADCGDPYMGEPLDTFNKLFYFKYFEKLFCRRADHISVPIEDAKAAYYPEFRDKFVVISQGFNFNEIKIEKTAYQKNEVSTFAYAGGLIPGGRDPGVFLEYLSTLDTDFRFILYTKNTNMVAPWKEKLNGKLVIRDYIPRDQLLKKLSKMDFLVNFENDTSLQLPSKLIDYYLTGRPVLSVKSYQVDTRAVDQFLNGVYDKKLKFNNIDQYRIENVCEKFLELCSDSK